ncbi:MAG: hypothetical protein Q9187_005067 [Circinaria calcarea]
MPDPNRIRDNQRRSRARRKEYLQAAKQRLQDFERAGVTASTEIQAAARKVVEENLLLRSLLRRHGVTDVEISEHLRNGSEGARRGGPASGGTLETLRAESPVSASEKSLERSTRVQASFEGQTSSTVTALQQEPRPQPALPTVTLPIGMSSITSSDGQPSPSQIESYENARPNQMYDITEDIVALPDELDPTSAVNRPSLPQVDNTTSCVLAATILTGMGCAKTIEEVTAELGCSAEADCRVDNTTLFSIMDH